jgi:AcrR family transcriptional regulator
MPRISSDTVAAHVAQQEALLFKAALRLFSERGYKNVTLADIAVEVGLVRNSLYRYFPSKAHILLRWFLAELPIQASRSVELLEGSDPPLARILHWVEGQLDYAQSPEHVLITALPAIITDLDEKTRAELAASHDQIIVPLLDTLAEAGLVESAKRASAANLIMGMVLAVGQHESRHGRDLVMRSQLGAAISAILSD